jgi:lipoate-protein ligase A
MWFLDITLDTPAANLALDEALLEQAEMSATPHELLRVWEPNAPMVVLGRSSQFQTEVRADRCRELKIPILRRASGGATIITGPGCLMYAVLLSYQLRPQLRMLDVAHRTVMETHHAAISNLGIDCRIQGICDLTVDGKKFSGNSMRCRRTHLIYHGTFLYDFDVTLMEKCLGDPVRKPEYRQSRSHLDFVTCLPTNRDALVDALRDVWWANEPPPSWPQELTEKLVREKYALSEWTTRH